MANSPTGYRESETFKPNPTDQYGEFHTAGTHGGSHLESLEKVSGIWEEARLHDASVARRALDPNDDSVSADHVHLPEGQHFVPEDHDADRERLRGWAGEVLPENEDPYDENQANADEGSAARRPTRAARTRQKAKDNAAQAEKGDSGNDQATSRVETTEVRDEQS